MDLIYCDVLFNTGKNFGEFNDDLGSPDNAVKWYHERLLEICRILKNTGVIYIHCDYHLSHYLKIEMDKIFGYENFRNEIIWWYNSAPRKKKDFGKRHDSILRYSKSDDYYFNQDSKYIRVEYSPSAPKGYEKKHYYSPKGKVMDDVWRLWMLGQNDKTERVGYSTQKPEKLLYPIIDSSCPKDGIIGDFFMGSGTSAVVANKLNRYYIGCDISELACEITKKRLENCVDKF